MFPDEFAARRPCCAAAPEGGAAALLVASVLVLVALCASGCAFGEASFDPCRPGERGATEDAEGQQKPQSSVPRLCFAARKRTLAPGDTATLVAEVYAPLGADSTVTVAFEAVGPVRLLGKTRFARDSLYDTWRLRVRAVFGSSGRGFVRAHGAVPYRHAPGGRDTVRQAILADLGDAQVRLDEAWRWRRRGYVQTLTSAESRLFAAGGFDGAARWDGRRWRMLAGSLSGGNVEVLAAQGDSLLYAGGHFKCAGTEVAMNVARHDGASWKPLAGGTRGAVRALAPRGEALYVGGAFEVVNRLPDLLNYRGGTGTVAFRSGSDRAKGRVVAPHIARWDASGWHALGPGLNGTVHTLAWNEGDSLLYAGGEFTEAGGREASHIARWNGTRWAPLGGGLDGPVHVLLMHASDLYVGGAFARAGAQDVRNVARWDGQRWHALGGGVDSLVYAMAARGADVYVASGYGGWACHVHRWSEGRWRAIGRGRCGAAALAAFGDTLVTARPFPTAERAALPYSLLRLAGSRWRRLAPPLHSLPFTLFTARSARPEGCYTNSGTSP